MELETVVAKEVADLNDEEKAFLVEHKDDLSDEDKEKFASVLEDNSGNGDGGTEGDGGSE